MTSPSVLFARPEDRPATEPDAPPPYFRDLNLDQIVDTVTANYDAYNLKPFFYVSLRDADSVTYRHEVFRDLENASTYRAVQHFAERMSTMRAHLEKADKLYYTFQKEALFLDAVEIYCTAILDLADALTSSQPVSRGLLTFRDYLIRYANAAPFTSLLAETKALKSALADVKYFLLIKANSVKVFKSGPGTDYSREIAGIFAKFKEGSDKDYKFEISSDARMNHIEAGVLDRVAKLYPDTFASLDAYYTRNNAYLDHVIARFDREIHFYVAYLEHRKMIEGAGLSFCYPDVSETRKDVCSCGGFDLALAYNLLHRPQPVVCNDFHLENNERIIVVTGPNQGGKTTFARAFGQLHHLASLGCAVPGGQARFLLFDDLFTHFEREERVDSLRGKLEDDLVRIHRILSAATPRSIVIMNEIFTSTTLRDAVFLSAKIMQKLVERNVLGVWVTFIDELASYGEKTVSMVCSVAPDDPTVRTYKITRRPADGLAYALAIAEKYGLTYDRLKERLRP
ncbi:MAG: DNA mismatch repair protein MutS [Alphaproteobacteria bacterium]